MKSVISKLYNGEIFPAETVVPTDSGYRSSVNKVGQEINGLQEVLTREQYKKLENVMDMNAEIVNMENKAIYAEGIRFGIERMIEVYRMDENARR